MKREDFYWLTGLIAAGILLWAREFQRTALPAADTLPLLLAFPLFIMLGSTWTWKKTQSPFPLLPLLACLGLAVAGELTGMGFVSALAWTGTLGVWLHSRMEDPDMVRLSRLLVLTVLGFPWLVGAAGGLGWQFRESAAWVAELVFTHAGFALKREGTLLSVQGETLFVEAACAGLGSLQAMLLAGTAAAGIELGRSRKFWFCLPFLFVAAWFANTLRVLIISAAALSAGHEFASGSFHGFTGWLVLVIVFSVCLTLFRVLGRPHIRRVIFRQPLPA